MKKEVPWTTGRRKHRVLAGGDRVPPWTTGRREDRVLAGGDRIPPWTTAQRQDALHGSAEPRPPWRSALITGASSGIGEALARNLAARGVHVILAARRLNLLKKIAMEIHSSGGKATVVRLDVAKADAAAKTMAALDKKFAGIDLVIANAGVGVRTDAPRAQRTPRASVPVGMRTEARRVPRTPGTSMSVGIKTIPSYSWEAVKKVADINYTGALATLTTLLPAMVARKSGHVVAISSLAGYSALPDAAGYSSPKAGLSRFMECLALDLQNTGVAVTTVHVGFVATPMVAKSTIPLPFLISAEKAADYMVRGFIKRKREINFPKPMVVLVKILASLPFWLKKIAARRYWASHRP